MYDTSKTRILKVIVVLNYKVKTYIIERVIILSCTHNLGHKIMGTVQL